MCQSSIRTQVLYSTNERMMLICLRYIAGHTRSRVSEELHLEAFIKALSDSTAILTYAVLVGSRKQLLKGCLVLSWLTSSGRTSMITNKKYLEVIRNWRQACDERGLSDLQRIRYNYQFLFKS